jgi:hypothetical protein
VGAFELGLGVADFVLDIKLLLALVGLEVSIVARANLVEHVDARHLAFVNLTVNRDGWVE